MMNVDQAALIFVVEYFEALQNDRARLASAYMEGARMILSFKDKPVRKFSKQFHTVIPNGNRKVLQCNGQVIDNHLFVHVESSLTMPATE